MNSLTTHMEDMKISCEESVSKEAKNMAEKMEESYKDSFSQVSSVFS